MADQLTLVRRICRVRAGLSQAALAARVGVSQAHFSQIELGRVAPGEELAGKIAAELRVPTAELFPSTEQAGA